MNYIVLDLEFNQAFPFKSKDKKEPVPQCPFEIIQIGAVKLDDSLRQLSSFDVTIQPCIYPRIHPFVEKITGIKQSDFKNRPQFPEAYEAFLDFIGTEEAVLCTWGGDDIKSLFRNIIYHKFDTNTITNHYINIQSFASAFLDHGEGKAIGLKNAVLELNLSIDTPFHNALNDAIYTARIFQIVKPPKMTIELFRPTTMLAIKPKLPKTNISALFRQGADFLGRELSSEEKKLVKLAYTLGRAHTFDAHPSVGQHQKSDDHKK